MFLCFPINQDLLTKSTMFAFDYILYLKMDELIDRVYKYEKIRTYHKPLLFVNTVFYIYFQLCLLALWSSQKI